MPAKMHALRIDGAKWSAALEKARGEGRTLTAVIDDLLGLYLVMEPDPKARPAPRRKAATARPAPVVAAGREPSAAPGCKHPRAAKGWCKDCQTGGHF